MGKFVIRCLFFVVRFWLLFGFWPSAFGLVVRCPLISARTHPLPAGARFNQMRTVKHQTAAKDGQRKTNNGQRK
jgi:hypothetical protein